MTKSIAAYEVVLYHGPDCFQTILASRGRKWITACVTDVPIHLIRFPITDAKYMQPLPKGLGKQHTPASMARSFLKSGRRLGMSDAARKFLKQVLLEC